MGTCFLYFTSSQFQIVSKWLLAFPPTDIVADYEEDGVTTRSMSLIHYLEKKRHSRELKTLALEAIATFWGNPFLALLDFRPWNGDAVHPSRPASLKNSSETKGRSAELISG